MAGIDDESLINFDEYPALNSDLNDDDIFKSDNTDVDNQNLQDNPNEVTKEDDFLNENQVELITLLLKEKGISDPSKIQIQDEDGNIEEINFDSLSDEEKLTILNDNDEPELSEYEVSLLNYFRENNVSLDDVLQYERQKAIDEYIQSNQNINYTVNDLTNEELYKFDLKNRYPDFTDEELTAEIEKELQRPDLFEKKVSALRNEYIALEQTELAQSQALSEQEEENNYNALVDNMVDIARNTPELYDLELEDTDKEEVLSFLLDKDINGQSEFAKLLNNPEELFKIAWFAIKGKEAFDTVHSYYKKEIDTVRKQGSNQTTRTVIKQPTSKGSDPYDMKW